MKQNRDFHRLVRVVYRACRRLYGIENTQEECLKVFKVIFPELYAFKHSEEKAVSFTDETKRRLKNLTAEWCPTDHLKEIVDYSIYKICNYQLLERNEAIQLCEDILPVVMRIRKLTPREAFRLMDVEDKDIDKIMDSGVSNSSCYKLAGNSIVVSCMFHIFKNLFIEQTLNAGNKQRKPEQLNLF